MHSLGGGGLGSVVSALSPIFFSFWSPDLRFFASVLL